MDLFERLTVLKDQVLYQLWWLDASIIIEKMGCDEVGLKIASYYFILLAT